MIMCIVELMYRLMVSVCENCGFAIVLINIWSSSFQRLSWVVM